MLITLRDLKGQSITLEIENNITLKTLKEKAAPVWSQQGHTAPIAFLVHEGLKLQDDDMLYVKGKGPLPYCEIVHRQETFDNGTKKSVLSDATDFWMVSRPTDI